MMSSCKTSWQDSLESVAVSRDSGENVGEIARDRSVNPNRENYWWTGG
jgi:hypothetical protein